MTSKAKFLLILCAFCLYIVSVAQEDDDQWRLLSQIGDYGIATEFEWSPDGERLAVNTLDGVVLFDDALNEVGSFERPEGRLREGRGNLVWSPDGRMVVNDSGAYSRSDETTLYVLNHDGELLHTIPTTHIGPIDELVWSPNGSQLAGLALPFSADLPKTEFFVWDVIDEQQVMHRLHERLRFSNLEWSDNETIFTAEYDDLVVSFDATTGEFANVAPTVADYGEVSPNGEFYGFLNDDLGLLITNDRYFPIPLPQYYKLYYEQDVEVSDFVWTPDNLRLIVAVSSNNPREDPAHIDILHAYTGELILQIPAFGVISLHPDGRRLLVAESTYLQVWDVYTGQLLAEYILAVGWLNDAVWSPDSQFIVTTSLAFYGNYVWNNETGEGRHLFGTDFVEVQELVWNPVQDILATQEYGQPDIVRIRDASDGELLETLSFGEFSSPTIYASQLIWRDDGEQLLILRTESPDVPKALFLWDDTDGLVLIDSAFATGGVLAFSENGLITYVVDGVVEYRYTYCWQEGCPIHRVRLDVPDLEIFNRFVNHDDTVFGYATHERLVLIDLTQADLRIDLEWDTFIQRADLSPDRETLAVHVSRDEGDFLQLWALSDDFDDLVLVSEIAVDDSQYTYLPILQWSPDSTRILDGGTDRSLLIFGRD